MQRICACCVMGVSCVKGDCMRGSERETYAMVRTPKPEKEDTEEIIMERMDEALKGMMSTPPETHKEMVERRRGDAPINRRRRKEKG
jgi:hypothetical protein